MTEGHLLSSTNGEVFTEYNMFQLLDVEGPKTGDPNDQPLTPNDADLVTTGFGAATFYSALDDNYPHVTLQLWSAQPPDPDPAWERDRRMCLTVPSGRLRLVSLVSGEEGPHELTVPPGDYLMHVYCKGRAAVLALAEDEAYPHGIERWMLRLWPATA